MQMIPKIVNETLLRYPACWISCGLCIDYVRWSKSLHTFTSTNLEYE